jgi:hypothetical protein
MNGTGFDVWDARYRWRNGDCAHDASIEDTWHRVARALAAAEAGDREQWARRFYAVLDDFRFLPGGRILAGAGTNRRVTLFNCFVMGAVPDSIPGIFEAVKEGASVLRPLANQFYGDRSGGLKDPFGHRWQVSTHVEDVSPEEMKKRMAAMPSPTQS